MYYTPEPQPEPEKPARRPLRYLVSPLVALLDATEELADYLRAGHLEDPTARALIERWESASNALTDAGGD